MTSLDPPGTRADSSGSFVGVVVLNWNGWRDTLRCLGALEATVAASFRVYVVDNASSDDSCARIAEHLERTHHGEWSWLAENEAGRGANSPWNLIVSTTNRGFAGGCNLGIDRALSDGATRIFLLNNDAVVEPGTLAELVAVAVESGRAAVGARVRRMPDHRILFEGSRWPWHVFGLGRISPRAGAPRFWSSGYVEGSAMMLDASLLACRLREEGFVLDPSYFLYCEETELCRWLAARDHGCVVARDAWIDHGHAASSGGGGSPLSYYYITRNRIALARRWMSPGWLLVFHAYYIPSRLVLLLRHVARGHGATAAAVTAGLVDGYLRRLGVWRRHPRG